jgi:hypothetical protein
MRYAPLYEDLDRLDRVKRFLMLTVPAVLAYLLFPYSPVPTLLRFATVSEQCYWCGRHAEHTVSRNWIRAGLETASACNIHKFSAPRHESADYWVSIPIRGGLTIVYLGIFLVALLACVQELENATAGTAKPFKFLSPIVSFHREYVEGEVLGEFGWWWPAFPICAVFVEWWFQDFRFAYDGFGF